MKSAKAPPKQSVKTLFPAKSMGNRNPPTDKDYKDGKRSAKVTAKTK